MPSKTWDIISRLFRRIERVEDCGWLADSFAGSRQAEELPAAKGRSVATTITVVGSMNLDLVVSVPHLPAPGETVLGSDLVYRPGGKGANQAVAACRLGADVSLFAMCGGDSFGPQLRARLAEEGVEVAGVITATSAATGMALIMVRPDGENTITVVQGANGQLQPSDLGGLKQKLTRSDVLLLQLEIPITTALAAARDAADAGVLTVLNAAPLGTQNRGNTLEELLSTVDVLVVNETEAAHLGGQHPAQPSDWAAYASDMRRFGSSAVVVTLGDRGAVAAAERGITIQDAFTVDNIDGTGAGDAFCGALAVALSEGRQIDDALRRACAAGALATTQVGAQSAFPTESELTQHISGTCERSKP